ncbi:MAG: MAPEG family protein [Reyranellaceae bacterium]
MTASVVALTGFVAWTLALLVLMEAVRTAHVLTGRVPANRFVPDNANLSPFMQRLARAHLNCIEGLAVFGGLLAIAIMTSRTSVTDPLALWLLGARIVQSLIHLASLSAIAVSLRFTAFAVQMIIAVYWAWKLLA